VAAAARAEREALVQEAHEAARLLVVEREMALNAAKADTEKALRALRAEHEVAVRALQTQVERARDYLAEAVRSHQLELSGERTRAAAALEAAARRAAEVLCSSRRIIGT
jgi:hypothetical protein